MPTVQLLARDNGFGLSRSLRIVAEALTSQGYEVLVNGQDQACDRRRRLKARVAVAMRGALPSRLRAVPRYDANIMLEHIWPEAMHEARHNIYMPNPEWVDRHDLRYLKHMDAVLGKTRDTVNIFAALGMRSAYVGFASEDRLDASVPRERAFFHLAGGAHIKGTERLLEVWRRHPEWPRLTVLQDPRRARRDASTGNIDHRIQYLDPQAPEQAAELRRLQNGHLFHMCPSETDGWGHYMAEGLGVQALVFTVDAPPMNEMITPDRGVLIDYRRTARRHLATSYLFDEQALERAVTQAIAMPDEELQRRRLAARAWFTDMRERFPIRLGEAMREWSA